jgi:uncharacterized pyridoxamine 5'-phosphate oxidase family protein
VKHITKTEVKIMEALEKICKFIDDAGTYYLATVEGDQPRVRPFGTILLYDGKLYIQTGKAVFSSFTEAPEELVF